jgi:hypothetical protein
MSQSYGGLTFERTTAFCRYGYVETDKRGGMPGAFPFGLGDQTEVRHGDLIAVGTYEGSTPEVASILVTIEKQGFTGRYYNHALGVLVL